MPVDSDAFNQFLDSVERFVQKRLIPSEAKVSAEDRVPPDIVSEMREMGLFCYAIPEEYGGLGLSSQQEMELLFKLTFASIAFRNLVGTNNGIGSRSLIVAGTSTQQRKYLPKIVTGELITAFALTEPDYGSDAASLKTRAEWKNGKWILNGTKRYISNGPYAGLFTVFARTSLETQGGKGVSAFLVEKDSPGLFLGKPDRKMGHHGSQTCDVIMNNCELPESALIGSLGGGFKMAMEFIDRGRLGIAAACVGMGERMLNEALDYAMNRKQFGRSIADFQLIQAMLADSKAELLATKAMVRNAAQMLDDGHKVGMEASCCKMFASEMVGRIADRSVQIHGGAGYMADYPIERLYRDARVFRIFEGTTQIQQLTIAKYMLKEKRNSQNTQDV